MEPGPRDRPFRRGVLRGTLATVAANGWAMVLGFITLPLLLGGLGARGFGVWVLLQTLSVTTGWLSLGDLGLTTSTIRYVASESAADRPEHAARVAGTALAAFVGLGAVWGGLLALLGPLGLPAVFRVPAAMEADFRVALHWFALQVAVEFAVQGVLAVLEGNQAVDRSRGVEMLRRTLVGGGSAIAAVTGFGLVGAASAAFAGTAVTLLVAVRVLLRSPTVAIGRPHASAARQLARYGTSVALLRPLGVVHRTMDRVVVGIVLGPSAVTVVEIATQLQNGSAAVLGASSYAVTPGAAWLDGRGDQHRLRELVEIGTRYTLFATLPVIVLTAALAGPAIALWVGPGYGSAVGPTMLAVAYIAVVAPLQVGSNLLVGVGNPGAVIRAAGLGLALNLGLSLALVGPFGITGVFLATLISAVVLVPVLGRAVLTEVDLPLGRFLRSAILPPLAPSALLGAAVAIPVALPLPPVATLGAAVLAGALAYSWAVPTLGMERHELRGLLQNLRRPTEVIS